MKRALIEQLWRSNPKLTQDQVRAATKATKSTVRHVYQQLVAEGVLQPTSQSRGRSGYLLASMA